KGRIIAVGTTSTRVLETVAKEHEEKFAESTGWTDIYIYPPYKFLAVDGLITNFHLLKSTLLLLISALCGKDKVFVAYEAAIQKEYRFISIIDVMFILPHEKEI